MSTNKYEVFFVDGKCSTVLDMQNDPPEQVMRGIREMFQPGYVVDIVTDLVDPLLWTDAELVAIGEEGWPDDEPGPPAPAYTIAEIHVGDPPVQSGYIGKAPGFWLHYLVPTRQFKAYTDERRAEMRNDLDAEMFARCI